MVNVTEQFKATTEEYVVISAIGGFIPGVGMYQIMTTLDHPIVLKDGYAATIKDIQTDKFNSNKVFLLVTATILTFSWMANTELTRAIIGTNTHESISNKQNQWQNKKCTTCNEQWPTRTHLNVDTYICMRCQRDKHNPKLFSADNDMDPGNVPPCLQNMTQIEELLIARACPIMTVYRKHGGQLWYSGHVPNLQQNIQKFINNLPVKAVTRQGAANTYHNFRVCREKALLWLKHNKYYTDIEIDLDSVQCLLAFQMDY